MTDEIGNAEIVLLKHEAHHAARDGEAESVFDMLWRLDKETIVKEILYSYTEEDGQNTTPLIIAARNGNEDAVHVLLNVFCVNTELTGTVKFENETVAGVTALWSAAAAGHLDIVRLLVQYGANVNHQTVSGSSPIRAACFVGDLDIVKYLVDNGADFSVTNNWNNTCLMIACYKGHQDVVQYLLKRGVDPHMKDKFGLTALHHSAEAGNIEIVKLLIELGSTLTNNDEGLTPMMLAALNGKTNVVEYLTDLPCCNRKDKIDVLEILATSFTSGDMDDDIARSYEYLKKAMRERYRNKNDVIQKVVTATVAAYDNRTECTSLSELKAIKTDHIALLMECLAIRERILGHEHPKVQSAIVYAGALFADMDLYDKCINLWNYGLKLSDSTEFVMRFPDIFVQMIEADVKVELNTVIEIFEHMTRILKNENNIDSLQTDCDELILASVYLIGIMLKIDESAQGKLNINRAVYKFIRQNPSLQNGFTPLHMCCDSATESDYGHSLEDVVSFPNAKLCKTFLACGAKVNAPDKKHNTPLHIIAKCADTVSDFDTLYETLIILIANGAHIDVCNADDNTAIDVATTDVVKDILKANRQITLKCLAARIVKRHGIQYENAIPDDLQEYVKLH